MNSKYTLEEAKVEAILNLIYQKREELVTAFIAQYNCKPSEAEIVQDITVQNGIRIYIQKRKDIHLKEIKFLQSLISTRGSCAWLEHYDNILYKINERIKELKDV